MNAVLCAVLVQHTKTSDFGAIYMPLGPKLILVRYGAVPKALLFSRDGSHINFGLKFFDRVPMCRFPVSWGFVLAPLAFWRWAMYI